MAQIVHGDGSKMETLEKAGIEDCDVLATITPSDEVNLMAAKLAKKIGCDRVVSRVNRSKNKKMFESENVDAIISYASATIGLYEKAIADPEIYGILTLGGKKADVVEVTVSKESKTVGRTIEELDFPEKVTAAMITRDEELIPPRGSTEFKEGDKVILAGERDKIISMSNLFRGMDGLD